MVLMTSDVSKTLLSERGIIAKNMIELNNIN